jgi:hypothetical protein
MHDNYSCEQFQEQQHAEATELLQDASFFVLITVDAKQRIKILDDIPGDISFHDLHCAFSMLERFAKMNRKNLECERHALHHDSKEEPE